VQIALKRVYEPPSPEDGIRVLVERLWPRGISKAAAEIDFWFRDLAPTAELRKWFGHRPERWEEFKCCYFAELADVDHRDVVHLVSLCRRMDVTFVFAARDTERNSALVLRDFVYKVLG
jgi:uncharacterized protein YeaO (DUF488 family)